MTADQEVTLPYDRKWVRMRGVKLSSMDMESLLTDTHSCCKYHEEQPTITPCALSSM